MKILNKKYIRYPLILAFWLILWELLSLAVGKEILLPSPFLTAKRLLMLAQNKDFYLSLLFSFARVALGYFIGALLGILLAVFSFSSGIIGSFLSPIRSVIKATPVASFILLSYLWMTKNQIPGFIASLMVIPIFWGNVGEGLSSAEKKLLEAAEIFGFGRLKKAKYIYIPAVKSYLRAALFTSAGLAWKAGIAAEALVRTDRSLGGLIYDARVNYESGELFAVTIVIIIISVFTEKLLAYLFKKTKGDKAK